MKLNIEQKTTYYILCPSKLSTGGPKHLHQLGSELKNLGKKVFMHYYPSNQENPVHNNYKNYNLSYTDEIEDLDKNVLVVPEVYDSILVSKKYKNIQKVLFWMSLDFFFLSHFQEKHSKFVRSVIKIPFHFIRFFNEITANRFGNLSLVKYLKVIYLNFPFSNLFKIKDFKVNLAQSQYQHEVLNSKGVETHFLNDFIRKEFFEAAKKISIKKKENIICYNPAKSSSFMKKIIDTNPNIKFLPLQNYNMNQVIEILSKSKIYIDFGFHPGVDGLPRESAILKNCVLTNKEGSAFYQKAVPINEKYKFEEKKENLIKITETINNIFRNFEDELKNFETYVNGLEEEELKFKERVLKIFNN